jgi:hypothetical protein
MRLCEYVRTRVHLRISIGIHRYLRVFDLCVHAECCMPMILLAMALLRQAACWHTSAGRALALAPSAFAPHTSHR